MTAKTLTVTNRPSAEDFRPRLTASFMGVYEVTVREREYVAERVTYRLDDDGQVWTWSAAAGWLYVATFARPDDIDSDTAPEIVLNAHKMLTGEVA